VADVLDMRVLEELRESVGGDQEFFAELLDELLDDAPNQLANLRNAVAAGDAEAARRAAHTLKGNGRTFGAPELSTLAQELEASSADGDLDAVRSRLDELDRAWESVRAALVSARDGPS
jgi:HPt (histidine-containing phosphotransfer) domain-containing protein